MLRASTFCRSMAMRRGCIATNSSNAALALSTPSIFASSSAVSKTLNIASVSAPLLASTARTLTTGPDHWTHKEEADLQRQKEAARKAEEAKRVASGLPLGCVNVDIRTLDKEVMRSEVPTLLYFHVTSHPEVKEYTRLLTSQVGAINREAANTAPMTQAHTPAEKKLAVKLGLVDCIKEATLAQQFRISGANFPMTYFLLGGSVVDQAVGIMEEAQIRDALTQFVAFADKKKAEAKNSKLQGATPGTGSTNSSAAGAPDGAGIGRVGEDEENPVTLLQVALRKLQEKDFSKTTMLLDKAMAQALPEADKLKKRLGVGQKKITPEMLNAMRKDVNVTVLPQILCARAMMALGQKRYSDAFAEVDTIMTEYPWAPRDLRQVADCVCRIGMIKYADYDLDRDNYVTLLKKSDGGSLSNSGDVIEFYFTQVRLACCHYFEKHPDRCIEELLKIIRVEPKLMPELKKKGLLEEWAKQSSVAERAAGHNTTTLARRIIFLVFDALGNDNQMVVAARKKISAYL